MENKKKIHLEVMRILACFFVIYHHTYIYPEGGQWFGNGDDVVLGRLLLFCCAALFYDFRCTFVGEGKRVHRNGVEKKDTANGSYTAVFFFCVLYEIGDSWVQRVQYH